MRKPMTADELKGAFAALPPMDPVEPAHNWRFWAWDLRKNIEDKDPTEFLTWQGVVTTMFVGNAPYIAQELEALPRQYYPHLEDPGFGKPQIYQADGVESSGNLIHQLYHIHQAKLQMPELDTIIEIGGGYGMMALICHRLGFRGRYIIYDLPEFSLLQQYYLSNAGVEGVEFKTQIDETIAADLLIGLYSLTEMPLYAREAIIDLCPATRYLLGYMPEWGGFDNRGWVTELMKRKIKYIWHGWNVAHLPSCWYLVGWQRAPKKELSD